MARRRRRNSRFRPRILPSIIAFILVAVISGLCYAVWQAQPAFLRQLRAKATGVVSRQPEPRKTKPETRERTPVDPPPEPETRSSDEVRRLKKEIQTLQEENRQLRDELKQTNGALAEKNTEIDDLRMRLLIRNKKSPKTP